MNDIDENKKIMLKGKTYDELLEFIAEIGEKSFRARQIFDWMYIQKCNSFDDMSNLSAALRQKLENSCQLFSLELAEKETSDITGTIKYKFRTYDNRIIESVLIPMDKNKSTLCLSTQIGCPLNCQFCATGKMGFIRNLSAGEIIDQYVLAAKDYGTEKVTNIVYMGMGEPLTNYNNTLKSLQIITSEYNQTISRTRITVSTAGIPDKIKELADSGVRVKLALSLHSCFDETRSKIMPVNEKYPLGKLIPVLNYYAQKTATRITFEYTLLKDINDRIEDINELVKICKKVPSKVNLIPFNSIKHTDPQGFASKLEPSPKGKLEYFANELRNRNLTVLIRETQGQDINAACGQLAALMKDIDGEE